MPGILTLQKTAEDQYIVTAASGVITDNTITALIPAASVLYEPPASKRRVYTPLKA